MKKTLLLLLTIFACWSAFSQTEFGTASFYGLGFHGKPTASGHIYSQNELTAAHKTLPLGTVVKVTNIKNNKSVYVKINDRGPYVKGRIIDLSTKAAEILGYRNKGTAYVKVEVVNNDVTPGELIASADVVAENGIKDYNTQSSKSSWKDIPTVENEMASNTENQTPADVTAPIAQPAIKTQDIKASPLIITENNTTAELNTKKDIPQPATEIKAANTSAIMNRSPYFIVTNLDKSKTGFFGVQLGVFSDPSVIFGMMDELEKFKQTMLIQQEIVDGKTVYKLYMGKFQNRAYADALKLVLSDKYKDAVVLKYE